MRIVAFEHAGNGARVYVNVDKIMTFSQQAGNGHPATVISLTDDKTIVVRGSAEDTERKLRS